MLQIIILCLHLSVQLKLLLWDGGGSWRHHAGGGCRAVKEVDQGRLHRFRRFPSFLCLVGPCRLELTGHSTEGRLSMRVPR